MMTTQRDNQIIGGTCKNILYTSQHSTVYPLRCGKLIVPLFKIGFKNLHYLSVACCEVLILLNSTPGESRCVTFVAVTGMGGGPYPHLHLSSQYSYFNNP